MRARNIKPGVFENEILGSGPAEAQLLFSGLWLLADREGIVENRPMRIRAKLFPYRPEMDIGANLDFLIENGFITSYQSEGTQLLHITNFRKHQNPHAQEKASKYRTPAEELVFSREVRDISGGTPEIHGGRPAESLNPESQNTDSPTPGSLKTESLLPVRLDPSPSPSASPAESPSADGVSCHTSREGQVQSPDPSGPQGSALPMAPTATSQVKEAAQGTPAPHPGVAVVTEEWQSMSKAPGSPFTPVTPAVVAKHTPAITKRLEDPDFLSKYKEVVLWLPTDDFMSGKVPPLEGKPPHVLAFGALINRFDAIYEKMLESLEKRDRVNKALASQGNRAKNPSHQTGKQLGGHLERLLAKEAQEALAGDQGQGLPPDDDDLRWAEEEHYRQLLLEDQERSGAEEASR